MLVTIATRNITVMFRAQKFWFPKRVVEKSIPRHPVQVKIVKKFSCFSGNHSEVIRTFQFDFGDDEDTPSPSS